MLRISSRSLMAGIAAIGLTMAAATPGQAFELHGSATVGKNIVAPNQAQIEGTAGFKLNVVMNGSGNGLKDLAAGKADVAMISAPLKVEERLTNAKKPGSLNVSGMQVFPVGKAAINVVVNPGNPVSLSEDQVRGIFTGQITNWKDVGGSDSPILVVVEAPGQGTRSVVESVFLQDKGFADNARVMRALAQVTQVVGQAPNAIGYGNSSSIKGSSVKVVDGIEIAQPLSLVTKGDPSPKMKKLIEAVAAVSGK